MEVGGYEGVPDWPGLRKKDRSGVGVQLSGLEAQQLRSLLNVSPGKKAVVQGIGGGSSRVKRVPG